MADDPHNTSDISDHAEPLAAKEDAETTAARRELKQTTISDNAGRDAVPASQDDKSASDDDAPKDKGRARPATPEIDLSAAKEDVLKEQISSPKKKRAHDELEENRDVAEAPLEEGAADMPPASAATTQSRTDRSEPEKKRPRDRQASASAVLSGKEEVEPLSASSSPRSSMEQPSEARESAKADVPPTSASAFAKSGFAKFAPSATSPFGALGGSGKPSLFGSASGPSPLSSSALGGPKSAAPTSPPKLSFGSTSGASPFAGFNGQGSGSVFKSSPFASAFGGGSTLAGPRLPDFGKPGEALKSDKPARPFGAPDSDAEDKSDQDENEEDEDAKGDAASEGGENREEEGDKDESKTGGDDKKKPKLHKVVIDDGEGEELTLFSVRAKMYVMEKGAGWKERGAGMLKVNVPKSTVELDDQGVPDPATFDPSVLAADDEDEEAGRKHVRLIMRQDHTLRVILNTVVLPAMKFQLTHRLKAATVLFTAFEGGEARQVQMKLSEANATAFSQLVEMLKKRLADV